MRKGIDRNAEDPQYQPKKNGRETSAVHEQIELILSAVADTYILFDHEWRYVYLNDSAVRAIGLPREQIMGRTL